MRLRRAAGALTERNFRYLFASSTISGLGDGISMVALVFAVLQVSDSAIALGLVLAARQIADAAIVLAAGVWADRLPRHIVLIVVAVVQGVVQAITGTLVLTGSATIAMLVVLQTFYGLAEGFYLPASTGLIPATVSPPRLQQANALLGLSRNATRIVGPAIGGAIVAAGSPGSALLIDAASFALGALLLVPLRLPRRDDVVEAKSFFADLRQGWSEFRRQTWIWTTIVFFGIGNFAFASYWVLGPVIANRELGGAPAWAALTAAFSGGALFGGLLAIKIRPKKPLAASCMAAWVFLLQPLGMGLGLPLGRLIVVLLRSGLRARDPHHALVHGLPAERARGVAVARQLLRLVRLVRAPAPGRGARRPDRRRRGRAGDAHRRRDRDRGHAGDRLRAAERPRDPRREEPGEPRRPDWSPPQST